MSRYAPVKACAKVQVKMMRRRLQPLVEACEAHNRVAAAADPFVARADLPEECDVPRLLQMLDRWAGSHAWDGAARDVRMAADKLREFLRRGGLKREVLELVWTECVVVPRVHDA